MAIIDGLYLYLELFLFNICQTDDKISENSDFRKHSENINVSIIYRTLGISWNLNVRHDTSEEPLQKKQNVAEREQCNSFPH